MGSSDFVYEIDQTRINLGELNSRMAKRIGPDRSRLYFSSLNRFLSRKLSKLEFSKLCISNLGRGNIHLHNELIRSILKNAYNARTPPPIYSDGDSSPTSQVRGIKDRLSSVGADGVVVMENGFLGHCDLKRPRKNHRSWLDEQPAKRPRMGCLLGIEVAEKDDDEVVEQSSAFDLCSRRNPLHPPLGIPFYPTSCNRTSLGRSINSDELCHTDELRKRMEEIVGAQGLDGVTMDCVDLLNNGIDSYLTGLLKSCFELVVSRPDKEPIKDPVNGDPLDGRIKQESHNLVSLQDFKVAMELNPKQLGEAWPFFLEKICFRSFEN